MPELRRLNGPCRRRAVTIDFELTLNRFEFRRVAENKIQFACFRIAWWRVVGKHSVGFEVNWRTS